MGEETGIQWCHHTFNPWIGCQKVSPACDNCYAETQNNHRKWNGGEWGPHAPRKRTSEAYWKQPYAWARKAKADGVRRRVFCASLADVFDNKAPVGARADLWNLIEGTPELDWMLLTKRPQNIMGMVGENWRQKFPDNVWMGCSAEDQTEADRRGRILREIPAKVRFFSCEPLLEPLKIEVETMQALDLIICGGESGPNRRDMPEAWAEDLMAQCKTAGVNFFLKQMTGKTPIPDHLMVREMPGE